MEKYKDVKISTMVRKLNSYLNEKEITDTRSMLSRSISLRST